MLRSNAEKYYYFVAGEVKEAMVPVVSTTIGLVAPSSSFRRMPPDGHEFPQKYTEKSVAEDAVMAVKVPDESKSESSDTILPPLPTSDPPSTPQKYPPLFNGETEIISEKKFYAGGVPPDSTVVKPPRNSFWRQDEKSEKSVRDKIAMFSSVPDSAVSPANGSGKLSKYKSSDDVFYYDETDCGRNIQNGKLFSRSVMTLDKVSGGGSYMKKPSYGDPPMPSRSLDYSSRTQSSMDLSSSSSSAYSSSCSPDSSLSSNSSYLGYSSTLPRKKTRNEDIKSGLDKKDASVHRTASFSVHGRSQSLLDVNPTPSYKYRYLSENSQDDGQKPGSLNLLIEQRRKNLSKLRGLVIPEKLTDTMPTQPIVDLPEIRSRDLVLNSKVPSAYKERSTTNKWARSNTPEVTVPKVTPTHLWDMQNKSPNIPKYSPAFKRKSISVFGTKELLALNAKKEVPLSPLPRSVQEPLKAPLKPPRNIPLTRQYSVSDDRKYQDAVTSYICEGEISYPSDKNHRTNEITRSTEMYVPKRKSTLQGKYRLHSENGRSEEDSDNDSAVSSSRSSISHGFSPPASPLLDSQYQSVEDSNHRSRLRLSPDRIPVTRTLSSETTASAVSTNSTLTSESQASVSSRDGNANDASNKRILKPQSVEAINRKNVLASAKYSRGFDVKSGSPLIQRKFSEHTEEVASKNPDLSYSINRNHYSGKYSSNGLDAPKEVPSKRPIEKIAYITDVVDDMKVSEETGKKKLEKSESVPLGLSIKAEKTPTPRKTSVPYGYSWDNDNTWNQKSFNAVEQVPVSLKKTLTERTASLDKPADKSSPSDKDFNLTNSRTKLNKSPTDTSADSISSNDPVIEKLENSKLESKRAQLGSDRTSNGNRRSVSVNDVRKTFEKPEPSGPPSTGRMIKSGSLTTPPSAFTGMNGHHIRVSSLDSTTSDDGPYSFSTNLLREQFGSITSLASSTSLISPQVRIGTLVWFIRSTALEY